MAWLLAAAALVVGLTWATTAASGADAHGYVSQADGWLAGRLSVDQSWAADAPWAMARWTLTPLGYRPSSVAGREWDLVPSYSPGLPLLMAGAKRLGGQEALFWVVPICGAVLVLAAFGITRRLVTPEAGLVAAWLTATSPAVLFMLMLPMSDVPAAAAWAVAFYGVLDRRTAWTACAGVAAGLAITIRPNLAPAAAVLGLWLVHGVWRGAPRERLRALGAMLAFIPGVVAGATVVALVNQALNGSPFISGYGSLDGWFSTRFFWPNLLRYGGWLIETQTPLVLAGVAALFLPARRLWPALDDRAPVVAMALFVLVIWISYLLYQPFDAWWYLRFVLPSWPMLLAGTAAAISLTAGHRLSAPGHRRPATDQRSPATAWRRRLVAAIVLAMGLWQIAYAIDRGAFRLWQDERRYVTVARHVDALTPPGSIIFSVHHSGSIRYYTGRTTVLFDAFEPGDLDRAIDWFAARGARSYLLIDDADSAARDKALTSTHVKARLAEPPVLHYSGRAQVYLYELSQPRDRTIRVVTVRETYEDTRSVPPAAR